MNNHTYNKLDDILQAEYKRGYEEGYAARKEADQGDNAEYYKHGLEEAWELAKKVMLTENEGGFSVDKMDEIFETTSYVYVFRYLTAEEAIEKIKEYEARQKRKEEEDEIKVGDEVYSDAFDDKGIVTHITSDKVNCVCIMCNGSTMMKVGTHGLHKTGRTFQQIVEVFEQME